MTSASEPPAGSEQPRRRRKLSAIMMVDVSGFSRMMGRDEEWTVDSIQEFHRRVQSLVERFEGRVVDTAGDSVFGEFDSVINAMRCARRIQDDQALLNAEKPPEQRLDVRIGVHLGDVIVEDYHVYGDGVNIAARLEPLADPGGICISEAVYQQVLGKLDLPPVRDLGLTELKNIQHPIRVFKVPGPSGTLAAQPGLQPPPRAAPAETTAGSVPERSRSWTGDLLASGNVVFASIGLFLLLSPILFISSAGTLPTAGAILLSIAFGRVWARRSRRRGNFLIALGVGLSMGALFTGWSHATNGTFLLAGAILLALGVSRSNRPAAEDTLSRSGREERRARRDERRAARERHRHER
jgi:class 3 adenylate cyclase